VSCDQGVATELPWTLQKTGLQSHGTC